MSLFGYLELLIAILCFLLLCLWRHHRNSLVPNWPVVGMWLGLLKNLPRIHDYATEVLKKSGGTFEFKGPWLGNMDFVATSDPVNMQHILIKKFHNYPKGPESRDIFGALGDGIFNSDLELWKSQRKMLQLLIGHKKFELFMKNTIQRIVLLGLVPVLDHLSKTGIEADLQDVFSRLTFDNVCILVFGFNPATLSINFPKVAYLKAYDVMEENAFHRLVVPHSYWKLKRWLQIGEEKKASDACRIFDDFLYKRISMKREELNQTIFQNDECNIDLLTAYIKQEAKEGYKNSNKFLRDVAFNFIAAGRDTIAISLSWFIWLVATHPYVETKILDEMKENLAEKYNEKSGFFDEEKLNKLVFLQASICETLRLYPPVPINQKCAIQPDTLPCGQQLGKNTRLLLCFYSMARMKDIWGEDCLEFKPERWISNRNEIVHVPSYKFTAFNSGPRTCLGKDMSFIQIKVVAATMIWNYRVHVVEQHPISPGVSMVLNMKHGLKVRISQRSM